ncbi:MAG TPA: prolyl oligopeptidase family serine peptidase [Panacibacter sp.]|nr:prolyl oligopeptidase family serine peptidase [Panacibacter sp.]
MKYFIFLALISGLTINCFAQFKYPATKTVDSSDTWYNITIKDPYRWLEDLKSEETKNWFKAQNDYTNIVLEKLPLADELYNEFLRFDSIQTDLVTRVRQIGTTFYYFNLKPKDTKKILYRRIGENGKDEVFASSEMWGNDFQLNSYDVDPYQQYLAITATKAGNERNVVKFYSLAQNKFLTDSLPGLFAGFAPGNGNVYYEQLPSYDVHQKIDEKDRLFKIHKIGTDTLQDKILFSYQTNPELYSTDNKARLFPVWPGYDFNYEIIHYGSVSPYREIYYRKINSAGGWKKIISFADEVTAAVTGSGDKLFFISKKNAPNGKLMMIDMAKADADITKAITIAKEKEVPLITGIGISQTKNFLILPYQKNGVQVNIDIVDKRTNKISKNPFAENTNVILLTPYNLSNDDVLITRHGWATPSKFTNASIDKPLLKEKKLSFRKDIIYPNTGEITVEELEIPGHDGVLIPVSIIHKKDIKLDGKNPTYVYGYGAYGASSFAGFNPDYLLMANKGMIIVISHVRGGGEKGKSWHLAGNKQSKPNSWKDFNSTAEYLINKGYTSAKHLACEGGSAGGILIGRAITERPDLWACAVPTVGVLSIMRQEFTPNGPINAPEHGSIYKINEFFALMEMDATLHVQNGTKYPAMLITTGWNDPRVISWQPAKFAATVQQANASDKPVLLQVDYAAGHGASADKFDATKNDARKWAFILEHTGYKK